MQKKSQRLEKSLKGACLILSILILNACARVQIKDAEYCGDMGPMGASCFHTISDENRDIEKAQWDAERFGMICTKSENYANLKASLLKLCHYAKICTYEEKKLIESFGAHLDAMDARVKALGTN